MTTEHSAVNGVIGTNLIYKDIIKNLCHKSADNTNKSLHKATKSGMAWGYLTGESKNIDFGTTLAVSEIHNVVSLLEDVERGELTRCRFHRTSGLYCRMCRWSPEHPEYFCWKSTSQGVHQTIWFTTISSQRERTSCHIQGGAFRVNRTHKTKTCYDA